jgi:hypothetical protein
VKDEMYAYTTPQEHEQLNTIASGIQISNISGNMYVLARCDAQYNALVI